MSVKSHELENREQGPPPRGTAKVQAEIVAIQAKRTEDAGERDARLVAAFAAARAVRPGREVTDGAAFGEGRDAAIAAMEAALAAPAP